MKAFTKKTKDRTKRRMNNEKTFCFSSSKPYCCSAAESTSSDNTVYYYVDREGAMYELSEDQYTEVMTEDNLEMVVA